MFDTPVVVPDSANTLELSRLYIYKVMQDLGQQPALEFDSETQTDEISLEGEETSGE